MMKKVKWKKLLLILLTSIGVISVAAGNYAWGLVVSTYTNIQADVERKETKERLEAIDFGEGDPFSVLLMGIDEPGDNGDNNQRADTLIYLTVNPDRNSFHMVSIPRDTYTDIVGKGKKDKINHSYAFGGQEMTIRTVEKFLDVPVDYFIQIDLEGFEDMVDAVGGVDVHNDFDFTYKDVHFEKGPNHLNGNEAVKYTRMRKDDPRGDFGRQERQREVILNLIHQGKSMSSITRVKDIFSVVEKNVQTNFNLKELWTIQSNYRSALDQIHQHEIKGKDGSIDETYYYMPDQESLKKLSNDLKKHLENPKSS